jgi:hypothetical protein
MRANDATELGQYLRHVIVPEQAELIARKSADAPLLAETVDANKPEQPRDEAACRDRPRHDGRGKRRTAFPSPSVALAGQRRPARSSTVQRKPVVGRQWCTPQGGRFQPGTRQEVPSGWATASGLETEMTDIFAIIADAQKILRKEAGLRGVDRMLVNDCEFKVASLYPRGNHPAAWFVTCQATTRGGLLVPLVVLVTPAVGYPVTGRGLASAVLATLVALRDDAKRHEAAKREMETAVRHEIALAAERGIPMRLVDISERPIDPTDVDDRHNLSFDISIEMLNPDDLEPDTYTMGGRDPEEFSAYLSGCIVPEQAELILRRKGA